MTNIVPNFNADKIIFVSENRKLNQKVELFIEEWNNELDFFTAKTSGSTGIPKEIKLLKNLALASVKMSSHYFNFDEMESMGLCLSPETIAGKMQILRALYYDLVLYVFENERNCLQNLNVHLDFITLVPLQVESILNENPEKLDFCRKILIGGAKISPALEHKLKTVKCKVYESYGMTETYSHVAIRQLFSEKTVFEALQAVHFSLENDNLVIHATHLGLKHLKTNDCVNLIDNKHFELLGRSDFVINSGAFKFHPEVLEEKLASEIQGVFFILGEKDQEFGEIVTFFLEMDYDSKKEDELKELFSRCLSKYEIPKKIYFIPHFSRTESGKIDKLKTQKIAFEH